MKRFFALFLVHIALASTMSGQGHAHGIAELDIGIDGRAGMLELRIPDRDLFGFERAPRTPQERAKRDSALVMLRTQGSSLVQFDATFGCTVSAGTVTSTTGEHTETRARYAIECRNPPTGKPIRFAISARFPSVHRVKVQLVTGTTQKSATIVGDKGSIQP